VQIGCHYNIIVIYSARFSLSFSVSFTSGFCFDFYLTLREVSFVAVVVAVAAGVVVRAFMILLMISKIMFTDDTTTKYQIDFAI